MNSLLPYLIPSSLGEMTQHAVTAEVAASDKITTLLPQQVLNHRHYRYPTAEIYLSTTPVSIY
jgi:hypothetical protein